MYIKQDKVSKLNNFYNSLIQTSDEVFFDILNAAENTDECYFLSETFH